MPDLNSFCLDCRQDRRCRHGCMETLELVFSVPFRSNHLRSQFFDYTRTDMGRQ